MSRLYALYVSVIRKIIELEEELKIVTNNMKSLEIAEQEVIAVVLWLFKTHHERLTQHLSSVHSQIIILLPLLG